MLRKSSYNYHNLCYEAYNLCYITHAITTTTSTAHLRKDVLESATRSRAAEKKTRHRVEAFHDISRGHVFSVQFQYPYSQSY